MRGIGARHGYTGRIKAHPVRSPEVTGILRPVSPRDLKQLEIFSMFVRRSFEAHFMNNAWHVFQDQQITDGFEIRDSVYNDPDASLRSVAATSNKFLGDKHFINCIAEKSKLATFSLMDVGCGAGEFLARVIDFFPNATVSGVDTNAKSIEIAAKKAVGNVSVGGFEDLSGQYDIVACCEVYEHVGHPDALVRKLFELTRPGGLVSFSTPSGWMYWRPSALNIIRFIRSPRRFTRLFLFPERHWSEALSIHPAMFPKTMKAKLVAAGFEVVDRQSSIWFIHEKNPVRLYLSWKAKRSPVKSARMAASLYWFLESLMNLVPLFRIFESRQVWALRKPR